MRSRLSWIAIIVFTIAVAASNPAMMTWTVQAQSTPGAPAGVSPMDHMMMHGHGQAVSKDSSPITQPGDPRVLVALPAPMQEHMLANMRDHLATLNAAIGDIADNKFDSAGRLLEQRLGMSSLSLHHAAEMAPYFPKPMQDAGTGMHHAASRLAIVLQDASVEETFESMRKVNAALHEVTSACVACHAMYRVR